ncbi:MAG: hypothetical protein EZS28_012685 [Streblomastix strix]|uniref:Uncharacterized protein n=1 Tax=Streblomastix strix TaxID=222440 RepID=A0A5J4WA25_9EUKA|nr:MAG: hypothetical protein EZS28_012685 [Streblomastix strix]
MKQFLNEYYQEDEKNQDGSGGSIDDEQYNDDEEDEFNQSESKGGGVSTGDNVCIEQFVWCLDTLEELFYDYDDQYCVYYDGDIQGDDYYEVVQMTILNQVSSSIRDLVFDLQTMFVKKAKLIMKMNVTDSNQILLYLIKMQRLKNLELNS